MLCRLFGALFAGAAVAACDFAGPAAPHRAQTGETTLAIPQGFDPVALPMADFEFGTAVAVNNLGHVVGSLQRDGRSQAVLWTDGELVLLEGLSENGESRATDLNDAGVIVGSADDAEGRERAIRWIDGTPEDLGTLGGQEATALGINQAGQIVGVSETEGDLQGFLWNDGTLTALPPGPDAGFAYAEDINDLGVVVGWSAGGAIAQDATVWVDGVPTKLPSLAYEAAASAINNRGEIVGGSFPDFVESARAVRWVDGIVEDLPMPGDAEFSSADDINDRGHIAGFSLGTTVWRGRKFRSVDTVGQGRGTNLRGDVVGRRDLGPFLWRKRAPDIDWARPPRDAPATPPSAAASSTTPPSAAAPVTRAAPVAAPSPSRLCRTVPVPTRGIRALCGR